MTIPEALIVAASSNRQMHAAGYTNYEVVREEALEVLALELERAEQLREEVGRLQAELTRVTRPFFLHQSAYVQFGPVTPPSSR